MAFLLSGGISLFSGPSLAGKGFSLPLRRLRATVAMEERSGGVWEARKTNSGFGVFGKGSCLGCITTKRSPSRPWPGVVVVS